MDVTMHIHTQIMSAIKTLSHSGFAFVSMTFLLCLFAKIRYPRLLLTPLPDGRKRTQQLEGRWRLYHRSPPVKEIYELEQTRRRH
jgi:hypothetical protein